MISGKTGGGVGEIEQVIAGRTKVFVVLRQALFEHDEVALVVEIGGDVADAFGEVIPDRTLRLLAFGR